MEILLLKLNLYQILKQFISKLGKLTSKYIIINDLLISNNFENIKENFHITQVNNKFI